MIDLSQNAAFKALLGFDFIRKSNLKIYPDISARKIEHETIPFVHGDDNHRSEYYMTKNINMNDFVNVPPFIPSSHTDKNQDRNNIQPKGVNKKINAIMVKTTQKAIAPPKESLFVERKCSIPVTYQNKEVTFIPLQNEKNDIIFHDGLHTYSKQISETDNKCEKDKNKSDSDQQTVDFCFRVFVENQSNETIHTNKHPVDPLMLFQRISVMKDQMISSVNV